MHGINKVILIGNLGADPKIQNSVTRVSVATTEYGKESVEQKEKTEWHHVIFFKSLAEIASKYLKKGCKIYVEGSLHTRKWTDKYNVERYITEIYANKMQILDSKPTSSNENITNIVNDDWQNTVLKINETVQQNTDNKSNDIPF